MGRFIVIDTVTGRIVATAGGTHRSMERVCNLLDRAAVTTGRYGVPSRYVYDDASNAGAYLPQIGGNLSWRRSA